VVTLYKRKANFFDGKPCAVKVARTVWVGGKLGDNIKELPIDIRSICSSLLSDGMAEILLSGGIYGGIDDICD